MNDATAIVVFNIILGIILTGSFAVTDPGFALGVFVKVFAGGAVTGFITGIVLSEMVYRLRTGISSYLIMPIVLVCA